MATKPELPGEPCSDEHAALHLRMFIDAFVRESRRGRARLMLLEKPKRRGEALRQLWDWLDPACCRRLESPEHFQENIVQKHGDRRGVLIAGHRVRSFTLSEALSFEGSEDVIFSIEPGRSRSGSATRTMFSSASSRECAACNNRKSNRTE